MSNLLNSLNLIVNGGPGSGDFGHYGRPGEVGGSAPSGSAGRSSKSEKSEGEESKSKSPSKKGMSYDDYSSLPDIHREAKAATDFMKKFQEKIGFETNDSGFKDLKDESWVRDDGKVSLEEYKEKLLSFTYDKNLKDISTRTPEIRYIIEDMLATGAIKSETLEGFMKYVHGANSNGYGKKGKDPRKRFDEKYGISKFIDSNPEFQFSGGDIYRGMSTTKEFVTSVKKGDSIDMRGVSSWSSDKSQAESFTTASLVKDGNEPVVFVNKQKSKEGTMIFPFSYQNEVLLSGNKKCTVTDITNKDGVTYIDVEFN